MQPEEISRSKTLMGVSDLTLVATIKRGLIPAQDSRSYESRARLLMKTLNTLRISSREVKPTPLIEDVVDRIRAIHSFRLAFVEGPMGRKQLLLNVVFDGGWEPYMRRIWRDLGPLLDVIFCNCDGYLTSYDHSFAEYAGWVRSVQVNTELFYNASSLTVTDLHYLRESARQQIDDAPAPPRPAGDIFEQGLPAVTALYRLTDMYPHTPGHPDGECLLRAARHLLSGNKELTDRSSRPLWNALALNASERAALEWVSTPVPDRAKRPPAAAVAARNVQSGILTQYKNATHGCLLLIELKDAASAIQLLGQMKARVVSASDQALVRSGLFVNVAFTHAGLHALGVPAGVLGQLPQEFREGMAWRAGLLGDQRYNHPTKWALPPANWPLPAPGAPAQARVELSSVHAIVQLCGEFPQSPSWVELDNSGAHPLCTELMALAGAIEKGGNRILSVEPMQRYATNGVAQGHFGFVDGISQPVLGPDGRKIYSDEVPPGDILLGYENTLQDPPAPTGRLWKDSSYLVIRKLKQDAPALDKLVHSAAAPAGAAPSADDVKAQMMGRKTVGASLIPPFAAGNDFNYAADTAGSACPFHSHARRVNPRSTRPDLPTIPRIIRRGMSYGPKYQPGDPAADRGLLFMAYNASIAEQFEVIQAWLAGGNSGGEQTYSGLRDPFLGVLQDGDPRSYRFGAGRVTLDPDQPLVRLEWGAYTFVPSLDALDELEGFARNATDSTRQDEQRRLEISGLAQKGAVIIGRLRQLEQLQGFDAAAAEWKIALEDVSARMGGISRAIWTAIRELHQGVLRTPYGVLVCKADRVKEVLENRANRYTVTGYAERMRKSFGEIYLGMDDGDGYRKAATEVNLAIMGVSEEEAFKAAFAHTQAAVTQFSAPKGADGRAVEVKDLVDDVLARFCAQWFGVPDAAGEVLPGGWHWRDTVVTCPGHFSAPSRYMFQPNPGDEATKLGQRHGQALNAAVQKIVDRHRKNGTTPTGRLGQDIFNALRNEPDSTQLTRTLIGVMMGFLPTVDGNLRGALYEWVNEGSLWERQAGYLTDAGATGWERARNALLDPLTRTLALRPVPELTWRVAVREHDLGAVKVSPGDTVVIAIVSATQQSLLDDKPDLAPLFGGVRDKTSPYPRHACPGYSMAIGVMLGMLAGLFETAAIRSTLSPLSLSLALR